MINGWTGGQFSMSRLLFGVGLLFRFGFQLPLVEEASAFQFIPSGLLYSGLILGMVLAAMLAVGMRVRMVALGLWCLLAWMHFQYSSAITADEVSLTWLLLAFVLLRKAPYGSWDARGRLDPDDGWEMPSAMFVSSWVLVLAFFTLQVWQVLPIDEWGYGHFWQLLLAITFALLAFMPKLRPWLWLAMILFHFGFAWYGGMEEFHLGLCVLLSLAFDPAWIPPRTSAHAEILFFDGSCGLCHRFIRTVLAEERNPTPIRIAPLGGEAFIKEVGEAQRENLPDSLVLKTWDGRLLLRTDAVIYLLHRFGGLWRMAAVGLQCFPRSLRDAGYNAVARIRYRLFARPAEICPLMPEHLRKRFEM